MIGFSVLLACSLQLVSDQAQSSPALSAPIPAGPPPRPLNHMGPPDWTDKTLKREVQSHEENRRRAEKSVHGAMNVLAQVRMENDTVSDQQLTQAYHNAREAEDGLRWDLIQLVTTILGKGAQFAAWDTGFTSRAYSDLSSTYYDAKYVRLRLEEVLLSRAANRKNAIQPAK